MKESRQRVLASRLTEALGSGWARAPSASESEPAYTRAVLAPLVASVLETLPGISLQFRGDGGAGLSVPAALMGESFYPDLAVSTDRQHHWAAEVKFLRATSRNNSVATALGQASLYQSRYSHVVAFLVETAPVVGHTNVPRSEFVSGISVLLRPAIGGVLMPVKADRNADESPS